MDSVTLSLNEDSGRRPDYYRGRGGTCLEDDVVGMLEACAVGTPFEGSIAKVSGQRFPDILASRFYGVEVKSTVGDTWKTTGSSILESTRVQGVERIYLTFGKLGGANIEFVSRPYEDCLYDIAVTHMPRYRIDMQLGRGDTIFSKIGIDYEKLRQLEDPVAPVAEYYKGRLKEGERLWWTGIAGEEAVPATLRLWKNLTQEEKDAYLSQGCVMFPEVFRGEYGNYALWLASQGIVDFSLRDQFSAGGREKMPLSDGEYVSFPGSFRRLKKHRHTIMEFLLEGNTVRLQQEMARVGGCESKEDKVIEWIYSVARCFPEQETQAINALRTLFRV